MAGQSIGRFQIIREIGRGAAAVVYEALDTQLHRPVALKVLTVGANLTGEDRRQAIERFYREARSAGKLSHPNIAQIYDVGQDGGQHYIAMELCQGVTLRDMLRFEGRIPESRLRGISIQILSALEAAHAAGIIHRDIKPENIIIGQNDCVKLTDFGIAKVLSDATITQTGMMLGTPCYMSPEHVLGKNVDARSDLFSLGAVLYECLSGRKAFDGSSITEVTHKIAYVDPEPLTGIASPWPEIVMKSLHKAPSNRYQCATDMLSDIRANRAPGQPVQPASQSSQPVKLQMNQITYASAPPKTSQFTGTMQPSVPYQAPGLKNSPQYLGPAANPQAFQPVQFQQYGAQSVPDNLAWSILVTILCCLPLGIVSIIHAADANSRKANGDYYGAMAAYNESRKWMWVSIGVGFAVLTIWFFLDVIGTLASLG